MTFWERESNTLILRPVWPLEQKCTHAFVLTNRLVDTQGRAVQSPMPAINARDQSEALRPIGGLLPRYGLTLADVAFTWSFTTGSMTDVMEGIRKGLYGKGSLARLGAEFPVDGLKLVPPPEAGAGGKPLYSGGCASEAISFYWQTGLNEYPPNMCAFAADNAGLGSVVYGSFAAPNFMVDKTGGATPSYPNDTTETFDVDVQRGTATYASTDVTFWCALPIRMAMVRRPPVSRRRQRPPRAPVPRTHTRPGPPAPTIEAARSRFDPARDLTLNYPETPRGKRGGRSPRPPLRRAPSS